MGQTAVAIHALERCETVTCKLAIDLTVRWLVSEIEVDHDFGLTRPELVVLRARPATRGALGRASINSDAPHYVDPFHREVPEPQERRTQEGKRQIERDMLPAGWAEQRKLLGFR